MATIDSAGALRRVSTPRSSSNAAARRTCVSFKDRMTSAWRSRRSMNPATLRDTSEMLDFNPASSSWCRPSRVETPSIWCVMAVEKSLVSVRNAAVSPRIATVSARSVVVSPRRAPSSVLPRGGLLQGGHLGRYLIVPLTHGGAGRLL